MDAVASVWDVCKFLDHQAFCSCCCHTTLCLRLWWCYLCQRCWLVHLDLSANVATSRAFLRQNWSASLIISHGWNDFAMNYRSVSLRKVPWNPSSTEARISFTGTSLGAIAKFWQILMLFELIITDADTEIFALLKLQLKDIAVHFFFMQATSTIVVVGQVTNERPEGNTLGTYYRFKQYEQQEMKKEQDFVWNTAAPSTKGQDLLKICGSHGPIRSPPWQRIWLQYQSYSILVRLGLESKSKHGCINHQPKGWTSQNRRF